MDLLTINIKIGGQYEDGAIAALRPGFIEDFPPTCILNYITYLIRIIKMILHTLDCEKFPSFN